MFILRWSIVFLTQYIPSTALLGQSYAIGLCTSHLSSSTPDAREIATTNALGDRPMMDTIVPLSADMKRTPKARPNTASLGSPCTNPEMRRWWAVPRDLVPLLSSCVAQSPVQPWFLFVYSRAISISQSQCLTPRTALYLYAHSQRSFWGTSFAWKSHSDGSKPPSYTEFASISVLWFLNLFFGFCFSYPPHSEATRRPLICEYSVVVIFHRLEGMYVWALLRMFVRSWSRSPFFLSLLCCLFRIWHLVSVIALYSARFVFMLAAIAYRLLIRCHWLLAVLYSVPSSTVSPFSTPLTCRVKLVAYFSNLISSQVPISSITPLSEGEENQWLCIQNDCCPSRQNNWLYA